LEAEAGAEVEGDVEVEAAGAAGGGREPAKEMAAPRERAGMKLKGLMGASFIRG